MRGARDKTAKQFCAGATKQSRLSPRKDPGLLRFARNDEGSTIYTTSASSSSPRSTPETTLTLTSMTSNASWVPI
ncbi:hypothetical protein XH89_32265 [Bradyrhizobium sp. CCBAU 53340]|nr:hypothetical protein XH89_32265 [Bradyrhizobium sp. CCBAU 53340]